MDSYMNMTGNMNGNNNNTRPFPTKSRSNGNFSQALVSKSDIGDFQAGVFVMVEPTPQHRPQRPKTHKTPERNLEKRTKSDITYQQHRPSPPHSQPHPSHSHPHQRARSANDMDSMTREGDLQVSHGRLTTSPTRSPTRNKRNSHSPQQPQPIPQYMDSHTPSSPHKPRKAHEKHADRTESLSHDSGSPKDKGPSPPPSRWAGPAFSNAPPPSSLPIPDFPPFLPSSSPPSSSPSTSPSQSVPIPSHYAAPPALYQEPPFFIQPPLYAVPLAYPPYSVHYSYSEFPVHQPSLAQLSTGLRRMLNVNEQPIPA